MGAIVRDGAGLSAIEVQAQALDVALRAAGALKDARGLLPEALKSEGEIVAVLLAGQELGLPPMASLRGLQVVRGKVIISYDTMIALLRRAGYRIAWLEATSARAVLQLTAPDGSEHVEVWDVERAKRAGLWGKGTWSQYPDTMLRARCVSSAARAFAGEVLAGVYVEEAGERQEIEGRGRGIVERPASHDEPEPPLTIEAQLVEAERAPETPGTGPVLRAQMAETRDGAELQAWIAARWAAVYAQRGAAAGERVLAHAKSIGVDRDSVLLWLAQTVPVESEEAAQ